MERYSRFARMMLPDEQYGSFVVVKRGMLPTLRVKQNMAAWFRFNKGLHVDSNNLIRQWGDASGNGRHLKQATETNRPSLQSDGSILFDGVDNYLKCDAFTLNQPTTVYILVKQVTFTAADVLHDGNTLTLLRLLQDGSSPNLAIRINSTVGSVQIPLGEYGIAASVFNGDSSLLQVNNGAPATGDVGATSGAGGFTLGSRADATQFANIQVKEVLIYAAAHDTQERALVIDYLAKVGGLAL